MTAVAPGDTDMTIPCGPYSDLSGSDWRQAGDISGEKYDVWFRHLNGHILVVSKGDATGNWYKYINGLNRGSAAAEVEARKQLEGEALGRGDAW